MADTDPTTEEQAEQLAELIAAHLRQCDLDDAEVEVYSADRCGDRFDEVVDFAKSIGRGDVVDALGARPEIKCGGDIEAIRKATCDELRIKLKRGQQCLGGGIQWPNDPRDEWMYQLKLSGQTHGQIRAMLKRDHPEWDQLNSDQAVGMAIDRYCERKKRPLLRRNQ